MHNRLGEQTNDRWAQFDMLSDHLRGHCKHQTEESMEAYKKHIRQANGRSSQGKSHNDMMVDQLALPRDTFKGSTVEPHDWQTPEAEPVQPALFEMQEVVDGLPEEELQAYKDQMLSEISDREAIVDAINRRLDTVNAKAYTRGVRSAIAKQVKL